MARLDLALSSRFDVERRKKGMCFFVFFCVFFVFFCVSHFQMNRKRACVFFSKQKRACVFGQNLENTYVY